MNASEGGGEAAELADTYAAAFQEWGLGDEVVLWELTTDGGLDDASG